MLTSKTGKENILKRYSLYEICIFLIIISLPFSVTINSAAIICLAIIWIVSGNFKTKIQAYISNPLAWSMLAFFIVHLFSVKISSNKADAWFGVEKQLSLLIFPIILQTKPVSSTKAFNAILFVFIGTCVIASLICLGIAGYNYQSTKDLHVFFHHEFAMNILFHAVYFSYYVALAIIVLVKLFLFDKKHQKYLIIFWITIIYLTGILLLLASKMVIATFLLFAIFGIIYYFHLNGSKLKGFIIAISFMVSVISLALTIPVTRERILNTQIKRFEGEQDYQNGLAARVEFARYSLRLIDKSNYIFGVGSGDIKEKLFQLYEKEAFMLKFMPHNQYIFTFVATGLTGLLALLAMLGIAFGIAYKQRNMLAILFLSFMVICFITESALQVQKGIVFFYFFLSLLLFHKGQKNPDTTESH